MPLKKIYALKWSDRDKYQLNLPPIGLQIY